ncbi:hypothetical protein SNOG_20026 [Parastagonospora nodorum SN15]|uniref:Uncharacterized protein n=1 Tax=Phaeosphaeria nodorum (strain SN15 / ATCC MYA-4574 / FGSC 10173) TaxID=321614 RepID=A9JX23_PHANO|nr:hypothetical protein SNOG_20026 [Parastagonospora nodorum SN15]EDP89851.1 hypothetical protein SNOG_20026 [Parastagonospora nodorum SN15]
MAWSQGSACHSVCTDRRVVLPRSPGLSLQRRTVRVTFTSGTSALEGSRSSGESCSHSGLLLHHVGSPTVTWILHLHTLSSSFSLQADAVNPEFSIFAQPRHARSYHTKLHHAANHSRRRSSCIRVHC